MTRVVVHDEHAEDPGQAFAISRLDDAEMSTVPLGIFRNVSRPTYDDGVRAQIATATGRLGHEAGSDDLRKVLLGNDTWTVG